ncbi:hypothetical protein TrVE_jg14163 [Triparma verrucosa]|uniref:J domain-containing protein n=1 Tax=Triparma verrucosa TaxID=1606542 RepID=A0A9W7EZZ7_9STRA|nr:hypothetical protein TrVE_jg14163 [Triparma verrucosa]
MGCMRLALIVLVIFPFTSTFVIPSRPTGRSLSIFSSRDASASYTGPSVDLYRILNLRRSASDPDIKQAYKKIAREKHPDVTASTLRFDPNNFTTKQLRDYLTDNKVGTSSFVEKSEYISASLSLHKRTSVVPSSLQSEIDRVADEFSLVTLAYGTLSDPSKRRIYDLTGDWGMEKPYTPPTNGSDVGQRMGDRSEAARVRRRKAWQQKDEVQRRVYEQNEKERLEKEAEMEVIKKEGERVRARQREAAIREREENRIKFERWKGNKAEGEGGRTNEKKSEGKKNESEKDEANDAQEKIKAKWGDIFKNIGF